MNTDIELLLTHEIEQLGCVALEVFALGDEAVDDRAHEADVLGGELENTEGLDSAGLNNDGISGDFRVRLRRENLPRCRRR